MDIKLDNAINTFKYEFSNLENSQYITRHSQVALKSKQARKTAVQPGASVPAWVGGGGTAKGGERGQGQEDGGKLQAVSSHSVFGLMSPSVSPYITLFRKHIHLPSSTTFSFATSYSNMSYYFY